MTASDAELSQMTKIEHALRVAKNSLKVIKNDICIDDQKGLFRAILNIGILSEYIDNIVTEIEINKGRIDDNP